MEEWAQVMIERNEHTGSLPRDSSKTIYQEIRARQEPTPKNGATGGKFSDYLKELPITIIERG